jgi:hypothetical protein
MMDIKNTLEPFWRKRILFEHTPRGNIIMFYDAYKLGFSYYCDQKVVSYAVLNAVAMKYVTVFRCRHFFMDESILPKEFLSPLINIHFPEEKKSAQVETGVKKTFAKLQDYKKEKSGGKLVTNQEPEKRKNTFLYLGKMNNFQMLQQVPKVKRVLAKFSSPLLNDMHSAWKDNISYKQFKQSIIRPIQEPAEAEAEAN